MRDKAHPATASEAAGRTGAGGADSLSLYEAMGLFGVASYEAAVVAVYVLAAAATGGVGRCLFRPTRLWVGAAAATVVFLRMK